MRILIIGGTGIEATAVARGTHGFVSAVTVRYESGTASHHVWDEPLFESEAEALQFAWRRATAMARSLAEESA